jgi:uncharacterized protein (UPF0210 family)
MKIRSITCFYDPGSSHAASYLDRLARLAQSAVARFTDAGLEVQSTRLATIPFPELVPSCCDGSAVNLATTLEGEAADHGFSYLSLGPALPSYPDSYRLIPAMLAATRNVFFSGIMASAHQGVVLPAVRACGEIIHQAATITPDGFANLRFAALANVPAGAPFFPAAFLAPGAATRFALALEAADLVETAFASAGTLAEARQQFLTLVREQVNRLLAVTGQLSVEFVVEFTGMDFSPAPYPAAGRSLGAGIEALGLGALGSGGSLAAAAFLADALDAGDWPRAGFNGLMLPVLEDATLAQRAAEGSLTIQDLLLYSAVCGTGLDTVPLPGDSSAEQLSALLLDLAALAVRLGKPLTARLMPIPGKQAGDPVDFDFEYFAKGRVMALPPANLTGKLAGDETFRLTPRPTR